MNAADPFEALVNEHYEPLYRFALSLTRAESDACDLTQHTFYTWARKGHQIRDLAKVKTWLFTTLYRAFLMAKRRQHRFPHTELDNETAENLSATCPETGAQADARQVLPALARVDKVYQAAVALYYLDDCSYKEIAAILEVPVGTVKSRIARGIAQLREILLSDEPARSDSSGNRAVSPQQTRREFREAACLPDRCNQNGRARIHDDGAGRDYKEWDYSATLLPELLGFE